jgi:hypothetical protein
MCAGKYKMIKKKNIPGGNYNSPLAVASSLDQADVSVRSLHLIGAISKSRQQ